jgi:hypothetical protein
MCSRLYGTHKEWGSRRNQKTPGSRAMPPRLSASTWHSTMPTPNLKRYARGLFAASRTASHWKFGAPPRSRSTDNFPSRTPSRICLGSWTRLSPITGNRASSDQTTSPRPDHSLGRERDANVGWSEGKCTRIPFTASLHLDRSSGRPQGSAGSRAVLARELSPDVGAHSITQQRCRPSSAASLRPCKRPPDRLLVPIV